MHKRNIPYYTLTSGCHFGMEDIYFRMNQTQVELIQERKEEQAIRQMEREERRKFREQ